jgi:hypothetical protein
MSDLGTIIAALHDSEINGEISWFFDGVRAVKLGDRSNGYDADAVVGSLDDAADWLRATADQLYPNSTFLLPYEQLWLSQADIQVNP